MKNITSKIHDAIVTFTKDLLGIDKLEAEILQLNRDNTQLREDMRAMEALRLTEGDVDSSIESALEDLNIERMVAQEVEGIDFSDNVIEALGERRVSCAIEETVSDEVFSLLENDEDISEHVAGIVLSRIESDEDFAQTIAGALAEFLPHAEVKTEAVAVGDKGQAVYHAIAANTLPVS